MLQTLLRQNQSIPIHWYLFLSLKKKFMQYKRALGTEFLQRTEHTLVTSSHQVSTQISSQTRLVVLESQQMRKGSNDFNRQESISFNHYPLGKRSCGRGDRTFLTYHVIIRVIMALSVKASHPKWLLYQVGFFYIFTKWINFFVLSRNIT